VDGEKSRAGEVGPRREVEVEVALGREIEAEEEKGLQGETML
jgi:hypothetical protein